MRILFVTLGESIHVARWIKQLEGQDWDIHVFSHSAYDGVHSELENVTVHNLVQRPKQNVSPTVRQTGLSWPLPHGRRSATALIQNFDHFKQPARLARLIRSLRPDVIHSLEMQRCGYLTLMSRKQLNGEQLPPWIYSSWAAIFSYSGAVLIINQKSAKYFRCVTTSSQTVKGMFSSREILVCAAKCWEFSCQRRIRFAADETIRLRHSDSRS